MNKKAITAAILLVFGIFLLIGSFKIGFDFKPLGLGIGLITITGLIGLSVWQNKIWNTLMYVGAILLGFSVLSIFATIEFLPDLRPIITMSAIAVISIACFNFGFTKSAQDEMAEKPIDYFNFLATLVIVFLFGISLVLLPQIDWQYPKDPASVMILTFLTALLIIYALIIKHPAKKQIVCAGLIETVNFFLIPIYEAGTLNFIAKFYQFFDNFYASFDQWAKKIEYTLIILTIILIIFTAIKKIEAKNLGKITLIYFILMPLMAIFLFEMMGLPAGFLAGNTTRSDLLVTDTNAVMATFGMIFIGTVCYITFQLFPFWLTPLIAGAWWVFWKPWLLHHPDPALFKNFTSFVPAGLFLFFTGIKRVVLPMIIIIFTFGLKPKK